MPGRSSQKASVLDAIGWMCLGFFIGRASAEADSFAQAIISTVWLFTSIVMCIISLVLWLK